jgi:methylmalonyl-CoA mutase
MDNKYKPQNQIRIVSATSLFDGHDAAINIMRRIFQSYGVEVVHLGHNRSAQEIVQCAIQEDVQGIAITSYQGGHLEFFKYIHDLLKEAESPIKIIGGGGGTILPSEIQELHAYGIEKIYAPADGRKLGLTGMIEDAIQRLDFSTIENIPTQNLKIPQLITLAENDSERFKAEYKTSERDTPILGVTGTGGAGKSSLVDELIRRFTTENPDKSVAIVSIDPSRRKTGGALLGDRIRMNSVFRENIYMRSLATRAANTAISEHLDDVLILLKSQEFDLIILESSGIGQSDSAMSEFADICLYVMTSEYGAATQLEKIDMLDFADAIAVNKFDKGGSLDAYRDVLKQYRRNHELWDASDDDLPVFGTIASQFNDSGINGLYNELISRLNEMDQDFNPTGSPGAKTSYKQAIIPSERSRYLDTIVDTHKQYKSYLEKQAGIATEAYQIDGTLKLIEQGTVKKELENLFQHKLNELDEQSQSVITNWDKLKQVYTEDTYTYKVRNKDIVSPLFSETLSGTKIPKVVLPTYRDWGDILRWRYKENFPGRFPFTSGVFPLKRKGESPTRMFAGEGGPARTNKRFHYLSYGQQTARLSTAFDSVTLYGEDPDFRPDIYGKVGNSGVSVATLDDAKILYSGFNLCDKSTSVSMTINGPAPIVLSFFLNAAIDQQCEIYIKENGLKDEANIAISNYFKDQGVAQPTYPGVLPEGNNGLGLMLLGICGDKVLPTATYNEIKDQTLTAVRGTVQADILKEDQAQNTCIFNTEFALQLMGDIQQYFIDKKIRNFYSVSISGYHIAEAGANPITQLAFTLANGFTIVEYYLSRGMKIDDFAPNLSFFFSNGIDAEYAVIGRVARRIWAKAIRFIYEGNELSQKLKYHIQTSGRSLHSSEIAFNDIRTTLQALYAINDNCNSLHTNAYDEAITTPTEDSVRRAVAIQLIINEELGLAKNENPLQGSFIIEELTDLVEEAVMEEFHKLNERGGVLGAMERMYQRSKIQEESMHYEQKKINGDLPLIGVNTFLNDNGSPTVIPEEVIRSTDEEKKQAIAALNGFKQLNISNSKKALEALRTTALNKGNCFEALMEVGKHCTLGEITHTLYQIGGSYRRNM